MTTVTVQFKAKMADGVKVIYEIGFSVKKNTEAARCACLNKAYPIAKARGVNVNACFHSFVVA